MFIKLKLCTHAVRLRNNLNDFLMKKEENEIVAFLELEFIQLILRLLRVSFSLSWD